MAPVAVQRKRYGNVVYLKITGTDDELRPLARVTHAPIKPPEGYNPEHIDIPITKHAPRERARRAGLLKDEE